MKNNPFLFSDDNKRYHTFDFEMKHRFGGKIAKIAVDAGFTCPNIDGSKGIGGCIYCDGAGSFAMSGNDLSRQFEEGKALVGGKWDPKGYLIYFQAHSNTYAPVSHLRVHFENALKLPDVVGLTIATRADLLSDDVLDLLEELSHRTFLTVELGLQTVHDETAKRINRCHTFEEFLSGYNALKSRNIRVGVHLINGLPGETPEMMLKSAETVAALRPDHIKLHMLHILKGTPLALEYEADPFPILSLEDYVSLVCKQIRLMPPETVIERVTGDGPKEQVIAPKCALAKRSVLAAIDKRLAQLDAVQGDCFCDNSK